MDVRELWGTGEKELGCLGSDVRGIVDEVVREVERRVLGADGGGRSAATEAAAARGCGRRRMRTLVLGELEASQRMVLESFSDIVDPSLMGQWDAVLVARMPVESLAFAALLVPGDEVSEAVISGLLKGKRVYILESGVMYREYRETAPKTLYQKYQEYENVIRRFGCEVISEVMAMADRQGCAPGGMSAVASNMGNVCDFAGTRLLRESDLSRMRREGCTTLLVGRETIITPLAQDYISNHHLVIRRQ